MLEEMDRTSLKEDRLTQLFKIVKITNKPDLYSRAVSSL